MWTPLSGSPLSLLELQAYLPIYQWTDTRSTALYPVQPAMKGSFRPLADWYQVLWPLGPSVLGARHLGLSFPTTGPQSLHEAALQSSGLGKALLTTCPRKSGLPQQRRAPRLYGGTPRAYIWWLQQYETRNQPYICFQLQLFKNTKHTKRSQNNMLLNNQWVTKNIKGKLKKSKNIKWNENTTFKQRETAEIAPRKKWIMI